MRSSGCRSLSNPAALQPVSVDASPHGKTIVERGTPACLVPNTPPALPARREVIAQPTISLRAIRYQGRVRTRLLTDSPRSVPQPRTTAGRHSGKSHDDTVRACSAAFVRRLWAVIIAPSDIWRPAWRSVRAGTLRLCHVAIMEYAAKYAGLDGPSRWGDRRPLQGDSAAIMAQPRREPREVAARYAEGPTW